ncbi:phosphoenolpyruvate mutase [Anabaena lutea]|uniref:phosphoenolpyruvate mutase n=1 Tax=Anabaena lutea FACHB-196 TaxID=2692881 RepID=A0ABR8FDT9_9NOST|nr:phosphoenolpyruvate mutase [Anabaena lutea]MBD2568158.1 phosphoenolpyruvate mutase [Anabaena lutea FACHB-196]
MVRKTKQLRQLLNSQYLEFLMEAHNGLSAKIVEEAGFKGIWASGLSISSAMGVRDNNEASWTQVLEVLEFMCDATSIPILLDGDTGYGNFNNVRRLVKKLEQRGIAGVCIEDKVFPKTNSFINGATQPLADIGEFCGKIKAAKDAQSDEDFVVIARIEAFIAGWGLPEALKRAEAYHQAGADGIIIHSSLRVSDEILAFKQEWGDRCPVVIIPTKYYTTPTQVFRDYQFSIVIWANQICRAAITAMQQAAKTILTEESLLNIEEEIIPVSEVFRLQGALELQEAEKRYLPQNKKDITALLLAASRGVEFGELTADKPKCMLELKGEPLLSQVVNHYRTIGIKDITVVRGYKKEAINLPNLNYVDNDNYDCTGELMSLYLGLQGISLEKQDLIIGYGDVLFKKYILQLLLDTEQDFAIVVDADAKASLNSVRPDYVNCSLPNSQKAFYTDVYLQKIDNQLLLPQICGIWTGLLKVSSNLQDVFRHTLKGLLVEDDVQQQGRMPTLINELINLGYAVQVIYITGNWLDVDEIQDIIRAGGF